MAYRLHLTGQSSLTGTQLTLPTGNQAQMVKAQLTTKLVKWSSYHGIFAPHDSRDVPQLCFYA